MLQLPLHPVTKLNNIALTELKPGNILAWRCRMKKNQNQHIKKYQSILPVFKFWTIQHRRREETRVLSFFIPSHYTAFSSSQTYRWTPKSQGAYSNSSFNCFIFISPLHPFVLCLCNINWLKSSTTTKKKMRWLLKFSFKWVLERSEWGPGKKMGCFSSCVNQLSRHPTVLQRQDVAARRL